MRLEVLAEARGGPRLGGGRGLIVRMGEDFDALVEDFTDYQ